MSPRQFFFGLISLTIVVLIGGGYFFFHATNKYSQGNKKLDRLLADIKVLQDQSQRQRQLKHDYDHKVVPKLPLLDRALPKDKDQALATQQISDLAAKNGVAFTNIQFTPSQGPSATSQTQSANGVLALPISFSTTGSYNQIQEFLQGIENFPRECDIVNVSLSASENTVSANLIVNMYLLP